jgi:endonuclease-3
MSTSNRAALLNKVYRILKRTYKTAPPRGERPLLESLLFASCLENTRYDVAQEVFTKLRGAFFDWNEIRVSTVKELAEVISPVAEPATAAANLKSILQSVFESDYSFELEHLRKQNIGAAVKKLQKLQGTNPFIVGYGTQAGLGGHSIPIDKGTIGVLAVLGVISPAEADAGMVPGMERAIPKSKGQEFGALLHELGAEFAANPFSLPLRELLLSIAPDAKDRFPKRTPKKLAPEPVPAPAKAASDHKKKDKEAPAGAHKKPAARESEKHPARAPKAAAQPKKKAGSSKKPATKSLGKRKPR